MKRKYLFSIFLFFFIAIVQAQTSADSLANFIATNKNRASIYLTQNDTVLARQNENVMMPLASTVKILVAIEFAKQAANKVVDEDNMVALTELDRYYLANTDGDAHPDWIAYEKSKKHIIRDSIALIHVARGMILFSSNANTEYLMEILGIDNVKNNIQLMGLKNHSPIYPLVASLFMYQNPKSKKESTILKGIKKLTAEEYCRYIYDMHKALTYDTVLKSKFRPQDLSMKMQKAWSDRLPASTTKDYVHICRILNNRQFFDSSTYVVLSKVLESIMETPANRQWLKHAGTKGGSTAWVLTKAIYATTKKGDKIEMAYFFNDLNLEENSRLQGWINSFELAILSNKNFRKKMSTIIK
jgi:D-alanyl-D-alanine carboxypeptidase